MFSSNITYQSPQPRIEVLSPNNGITNVLLYPYKKSSVISIMSNCVECNALQSYQFSLSNNDIQGSFSLTLFPDIVTQNGRVSLFDKINVRDVIKIYEKSAEYNIELKPIFTGVVNRKKFVMQAGDSGASRRLSISGTAITALVSQFRLELDTRAIVLKIANKLHSDTTVAEQIEQAKTKGDASVIAKINAFKTAADETADSVIQKAWKCYKSISEQFGTTAISQEIHIFLSDDFIECDKNLKIKYPMSGAILINANATQDFNTLLDTLFPAPLYEKTAYTTTDGTMKIRIRQVPFDSTDWNKLILHKILPKYTKSIDLEQSDKEVYTVFFSYLNGSPTTEDFNYILTAAKDTGNPAFLEDKFAIYGYRPLNCSLYGYSLPDTEKGETGKDTKTEKDALTQLTDAINAKKKQMTTDNNILRELNENLARWYGNLDTMLQGSLSLAMTYNDNLRIMPGDKVVLLGCEFYVEGITHSWNYGSGGDINISLSRGGQYDKGKYNKLPNDFTDVLKMFKNGNDTETNR